MEILIQLHGGHSGGASQQVKQSAPGSVATATIDNATDEERQRLREQMGKARGRNFTNKTGGLSFVDSLKKQLLGE